MNLADLQSFLSAQCQELGFSHYGFSKLEKPLSLSVYQNWLHQQKHGEMNYLERHLAIKEDHRRQYPRAVSAIVFAIPYFPHPEKITNFPLKKARVSLYAQGGDYHYWFIEKLKKVCAQLKLFYPENEFLALADSSPILERDLAYRAGLGWFGKNTCLIHPKQGSLFFLGEILTSMQLENQMATLPDFCGNCRRCIDICPTQAISEERDLDARQCISYLTIEAKSLPPKELRDKIGDWLFGCDLCQTVCPWNQKIFKGQLNIQKKNILKQDERNDLIDDLRWILNSSGKELARQLKGTALERAGHIGLKRNAIIVATNQKLVELIADIEKYHKNEKLGELIDWSLVRLRN